MESNPTNAPIAERTVLALMLADDRFRRRGFGEGLTADHFPEFAAAFSAIKELHRAGGTIDAATVAHEAEKHHVGTPGTATEQVDYISRLEPDPSGWSSWLQILRDSLALRVAKAGAKFLGELSDAEFARESAQTVLDGITASLAGPTMAKGAKDATRDFIAHLEGLKASGGMPGLETGFHRLDLMCGGMRPGELWTVLAKTSRGKTVLLLQMAAHAAALGKKVAIFSAEMMAHEIVARLVSNIGQVDLSNVLNPARWCKSEMGKIKRASEAIGEFNLWIDDAPKMTLSHIEAEALRISDANDGLELLVVDYIQIIKGERSRNESREQEVARISGGLKQIAKQLRCPVITAAQLNNNGESRESAAIAFDSDAMLFIADDGVKIGKLRNGRRDDTLPLGLNGALQQFTKLG